MGLKETRNSGKFLAMFYLCLKL
ncbi:hypothetical protein QIA00_04560 (plasmid) [Borreliella americana]|uniref:Uncharacterized protein n=1 Tax=Borreliella americana TaxID=478807 RepID=A0ABZ0CE04_9SPIR|nr:hypothetical protein [Borreliella americana]WKD01275.1 hypothetical protein QIA01_04560 [Borreliella americana]WNY64576.1 hypothetical protein QIA00_04560 [Borreliella americana]